MNNPQDDLNHLARIEKTLLDLTLDLDEMYDKNLTVTMMVEIQDVISSIIEYRRLLAREQADELRQ